ncbi:MAG: serine hydrolase domain-containing protein [Longimicrobiales bacterium]
MPVSAPFVALLLSGLLLGCGERNPETPEGDAGLASFARRLVQADSVVARWVDEERVAGAVFWVSRGGTTALERAYGHAQLYGYGDGQYRQGARPERLGAPVPMTPSTRFDLASVTKVMATTFAVMLLVDEGVLGLDAPVSTYLPRFTGEERSRVTIRQLLTHRAGLVPWQPLYYRAENRDEAYDAILELPLQTDPGSERRYSDLGFMLLGRVVEAVSGQALNEFLAERLYGPLGLADTGFLPADGPFAATSHGNPFEHRMVHDPDFGYVYPGEPASWDGWRAHTLLGQVNDGNAFHGFQGVAGHAGLFSTARDLGDLIELLLNEGASDSGRYLSPRVVEDFLTVGADDQALGWLSPEYALDGSFGHTGFTGTFVLGIPSEDVAIVLLTNRQNVGVDEGTLYTDVGSLQAEVVTLLSEQGAH